MKKILMLLLVVCLNGCYIFKMDDNLRAMYGQPIETAFQALGLPDSSVNVREMTVYIWSRAQTYSYTTNESADMFGNVGMTRFSSTMFYDRRRTGLSTCKIKIAANQWGRIVHAESDGGILACDTYAAGLQNVVGR